MLYVIAKNESFLCHHNYIQVFVLSLSDLSGSGLVQVSHMMQLSGHQHRLNVITFITVYLQHTLLCNN